MHCSWCARYDVFAVALPPLRPAAFFCAVVPPCDELLREELEEPDFLTPRLLVLLLVLDAAALVGHERKISRLCGKITCMNRRTRMSARSLIRFRVVVRVGVLVRRVGHGRLVELVVPVVFARVFHILFAHEGRPARQHRA